MTDFYTTNKKMINISSEMIEPFAALLIGRWFARCEQALKINQTIKAETIIQDRDETFHECLDREKFYSACSNLWFGLKGLVKISIACKTVPHFSIALGNNQRKIASYIEKHLGKNPISDKELFGF